MEYFLQRNAIIVPELEPFIPFKGGATWNMLWKVLYYTRLFKYVAWKQYKDIDKNFPKICSRKNLYALCEVGVLNSPSKDVFITTNKILPILKIAGFNTDILSEQPTGKGDINELNNTSAFIALMKEPDFYTLLYPHFDYLIPDALLVSRDEVNRKYRLTFIEVERKKPEWDIWIEKKKNNYLRLATDRLFYEKWKDYCSKLGFSNTDFKNVKFTVRIIGNIKQDFGKGFTFGTL